MTQRLEQSGLDKDFPPIVVTDISNGRATDIQDISRAKYAIYAAIGLIVGAKGVSELYDSALGDYLFTSQKADTVKTAEPVKPTPSSISVPITFHVPLPTGITTSDHGFISQNPPISPPPSSKQTMIARPHSSVNDAKGKIKRIED